MGLRYGLLAALTLVLASALLWDRLHPPRTTALFPRDLPAEDERVRIVVGGEEPPPPPPPPSPAAPPEDAIDGGGADPEADREYTVASGDTLGAISLATLGTSRRAAELAAYNDMKVTTPLRVGMVLRIPPAAPAKPGRAPAPAGGAPGTASLPPPGGTPAAAPPAPPPAAPREKPKEAARSHRVGKGDTLYALSRRYYGNGGRWSAIAEANGLSEGDPLVVGSSLRIP